MLALLFPCGEILAGRKEYATVTTLTLTVDQWLASQPCLWLEYFECLVRYRASCISSYIYNEADDMCAHPSGGIWPSWSNQGFTLSTFLFIVPHFSFTHNTIHDVTAYTLTESGHLPVRLASCHPHLSISAIVRPPS